MLALKNTKEFVTHLSSAQFNSNTDAIEFCRQACIENGLIIHSERQANNTIHVYCFRELSSKERVVSPNEPDYKFLLSQNESGWSFRSLCLETDLPKNIQDRVDQLVSKRKQADDIRQTIQTEFPAWNDHLLTEYLTKREKEATERVRKLIQAATQLCSIVAANEDWTMRVENDLDKMLKKYSKILKIPNELVESMVDIQLDKIYSDTEKTCANSIVSERVREQGVSKVAIPSCTLFVRSQHNRSTHDRTLDRPCYPEASPFVNQPMFDSSYSPFRGEMQQSPSPINPMMISPQYSQQNMYPNFYSPETSSVAFPFNSNQVLQRPHYIGYSPRMVMQTPKRVQSQHPNHLWP